jgi:hypothetical protein
LRKGESPFCQVRKGKKKKARWARVESASRERFFSGAFKTYTTHGKADPGGSHPMINEWGGAWVVPSQVRVV